MTMCDSKVETYRYTNVDPGFINPAPFQEPKIRIPMIIPLKGLNPKTVKP